MSAERTGTWPVDHDAPGTGLPLEGIKVLDLSRVLAGPLAAMILGDLGADVIKIEPPAGDPVRAMAPPSIDGIATYYLSVNRNRRSVVADLRTDEGRVLVRRLAESADAVVENFLPSQAVTLGIDTLRSELSDVVWVTVAAASGEGPLADQPSFDLLAQARSGLMGVTGYPESGPVKVGAPIADVVTGLYAAVALLTGLLERRVRPERPARRYEAPLLESAISTLVNQAAGFLATGGVPSLLGNEHPSIAPYAPYRTLDKDLVIAVGTERQWQALCVALNVESLCNDERFALNVDRVRNRDSLRVALEEVLVEAPVAFWITRLESARVPCAPVNDLPAAMLQEQVASGDLLADVVLESGSTISMVTSPLRIDGERPKVRRRPPGLGEHTDEVIAHLDGG